MILSKSQRNILIVLAVIFVLLTFVAVFYILKYSKREVGEKLEPPALEKSPELIKAEEQLKEVEELYKRSPYNTNYTREEINKQRQALEELRRSGSK